MDSVEELRAAVHRDPRHVADAALRLAADAREGNDFVRLSQLLAVRGRALRSLGEIDLAEVVLQEALAVAQRAGDDDLVADAHVALAGVLSFAGRAGEAFEHLDLAQTLGSERVQAYAHLQRAIIEQRLGHLDEALAGYEAALPTLHALDATIDIALVLMNRGVIRTQTADYPGAIDDLTASGDYFSAGGNDFGVAQTRHGLGWALARSGDLPAALTLLDHAATSFRALGHEGLEVDVDRIETLLAAGLAAEAASLGDETARRLAGAGNHSWAAEVWLLCARAALLDDDTARGHTYAGRARDVFAKQQSSGWELAARLELLRSQPDTDSATFELLAADLDRAGNARGAAIAIALAALAAARDSARDGELDRARPFAAQAMARAETIGVLEVRMIATLAAATYALASEDDAEAIRLVRTGLDDLQEHRSAFAASDARAAVSAHAAALGSLGMAMAVRDASPTDLLDWIERSRGSRTPLVPARPTQDPAAALELAELRRLGQDVRAAETSGDDTGELLVRQSELEREIRRRELRERGAHATPHLATSPDELRDPLGERVLVAMAEVKGRLTVVRVERDRATLLDLGTAAAARRGAASITSMLRSALRASALPQRSGSADRLAPLRRSLAGLDALLAGAFEGADAVVLVVPPSLHAVPWSLLPSLAGRPVAVAPSVTWWLRAGQAELLADQSTPDRRVVAIAGPRLAEAQREALEVAQCHPHARALVGPDATVAAVVDAFRTASLVHVASHVRVRHDNALWSSLELADGPLYVYDLEHEGSTPPTVVLSGCETGVGVRAGEELVGLSITLLERGTRRLVASVCELPDTPAMRDTMIALHERVSSGLTPAFALAEMTSRWAEGCGPAGSSACIDERSDLLALIAGSVVTFGLH